MNDDTKEAMEIIDNKLNQAVNALERQMREMFAKNTLEIKNLKDELKQHKRRGDTCPHTGRK